ncbi:DUF6636 domain-containing protein [Paractinoplanes globisporus]|uniref:DUF6636 domain-containing protein n=1 Tax=Paractinoplanes globisporus TaxID=113565 RepID=A0ABW6WJC2_9ACTN|nr:DUF6636 domain-containing protein [Actinoplanes globisporus]
MAPIRVLRAPALGLALGLAFVALGACSSPDSSSSRPPSPLPAASAGFGGPADSAATLTFSDVDEVFFQTPSKNIFCSLTASAVRCDIIRKTWTPPSKPADCELDWGNGMYIDDGKAGFTCTGDTLIGSATATLEYGKGYRSGSVQCASESTGLTCKDEKSGRGFTLAVARYGIF